MIRTVKNYSDLLASSVIAVPPLARSSDFRVSNLENAKIIRWLEAGGITSLLYGGNAVFYHIRLTEYAETLSMLRDAASPNTWVIPSVGPAFGTMMDQADVLNEFDFPTVMVLPQREIADPQGIALGIRLFAEKTGKPVVLYLKHDQWLPKETIASMVRDGLISWIKYAVVRQDPTKDDYLRAVLEVVPPNIVVSGIGEQPAIIHMRDFNVGSFTSGCVCVAPSLSQSMLKAVQRKDYVEAERIRQVFSELEHLRNVHQPIRVLHQAVASAGIADTGPILPMLGELDSELREQIRVAASLLRNS